MLNTEKKQEANKVKFAMANFFEEVAGTSTLTNLHKDFQDIFEVLMLSDEADYMEFRNKAILILQFTKLFEKHFKDFNWQTIDKVSRDMKDKVSLKMLPNHAL